MPLTKPWQRPPPAAYLFTNANIVDVRDGSVRRRAALAVQDGKIASVADASDALAAQAAAAGATVVDCRDGYLVPGLIDCHVHVVTTPGVSSLGEVFSMPLQASVLRQPYVCAQILHRGFTTIRDCAGAQLALKQAVADGVFAGPRIFLAGMALSQTGGHADNRGPHDHAAPMTGACACSSATIGHVCNGVPECLAAARDLVRTGSDFLKVMGSGGVASPTDSIDQLQFTPEELRAIVAVADNANIPVTAHAYTPRAIRHCIEAGIRGIEHGNLLDAPTAALMAARGVFLTPTLVAYDQMADRYWDGFLPPANASKNVEVLTAGLQALRMAVDAGVTVCFGTDLLGPLTAAQSREFRIRASVLDSLAVLQSATINAARMLGWQDRLGQLQPGFLADVLLCRHNPLDDIAMLDDPESAIELIMKDGRIEKSRRADVAEESIPVVVRL